MTSLVKVKNYDQRGDFVFRDVYKRHGVTTFAVGAQGEESSYVVNPEGSAVHCAAHITKYDSGNAVASYHLFTRNGADFDKAQPAQATVSLSAAAATFRSSQTRVEGGFSVSSLLKVDPATTRVGVNVADAPPAYTLDVNGDCNVRGNILVHGNVVTLTSGGPGVSTTPSATTFRTSAPFVYLGPGEALADGLPFAGTAETRGSAVVTPANDGPRTFTFAKAGTVLVQAHVQGGYPFLPGGDVTTYFVRNGDTAQPLAVETAVHEDGIPLAFAKTVVLDVVEGDTLYLVVDSTYGSAFEVGIQSASIAFLEYAGGSIPSGSLASLDVDGDATVQGNAAVEGTLSVGGYELASSVVYQAPAPFEYEGPGAAGTEGIPFSQSVQARGTSFVTAASGGRVFAFAVGGVYMVQVEVEVSFPWLPEGSTAVTYFIKNGDASQKVGYDTRSSTDVFGCTRSVVFVAEAQDTLSFVLTDGAGTNIQVGIQACRITFVKL